MGCEEYSGEHSHKHLVMQSYTNGCHDGDDDDDDDDDDVSRDTG